MIDYLIEIKPLELLGLTNEQIASRLSCFTNSDIPLAEVENFLDFENLAVRNPVTGNWERFADKRDWWSVSRAF